MPDAGLTAPTDYPTAFSTWDGAEQEAIARVVASGRFTAGAEVRAFEGEFAAYHGRKHAVAVNSGASANLVMVRALTLKRYQPLTPGTLITVPALAWPTSYAPLVQHGLRLLLEDCDDTWNAMQSMHIGPRLIVSILGNATKHHWQEHQSYVIEDNCESLGARDEHDRLAGNLGFVSSSSFYFSHQLSAIEGGMIMTDDDEVAELCRMLRDHGLARSVDKHLSFDEEYRCLHMGYNVRTTEINAAVGRVQLKKLDRFIVERRKNYDYWLEQSKGLPITHPRLHGVPSVFGLHFMVKDRPARHRLALALRAQGIDCRPPVGGCISRHPYGEQWRYMSVPNAERIHDTGLFLGNAPYPITDKIDAALDVMRAVL